jgi:hypothetical protein
MRCGANAAEEGQAKPALLPADLFSMDDVEEAEDEQALN